MSIKSLHKAPRDPTQHSYISIYENFLDFQSKQPHGNCLFFELGESANDLVLHTVLYEVEPLKQMVFGCQTSQIYSIVSQDHNNHVPNSGHMGYGHIDELGHLN